MWPCPLHGELGLRRPLLLQAVVDLVAMLIVETGSNAAMSGISFCVSLDEYTYLFVRSTAAVGSESVSSVVSVRYGT
jgi:hypothetical protein